MVEILNQEETQEDTTVLEPNSPISRTSKEDNFLTKATKWLTGNFASNSSSDNNEHKKVGSNETRKGQITDEEKITRVPKRSNSSSSLSSVTIFDISTASSDVFNSSAVSFETSALVSMRLLLKLEFLIGY